MEFQMLPPWLKKYSLKILDGGAQSLGGMRFFKILKFMIYSGYILITNRVGILAFKVKVGIIDKTALVGWMKSIQLKPKLQVELKH